MSKPEFKDDCRLSMSKKSKTFALAFVTGTDLFNFK